LSVLPSKVGSKLQNGVHAWLHRNAKAHPELIAKDKEVELEKQFELARKREAKEQVAETRMSLILG
jgi:hypothetical protein